LAVKEAREHIRRLEKEAAEEWVLPLFFGLIWVWGFDANN
jgi:hypothetical protein